MRLIGSLIIERDEEWSSEKRFTWICRNTMGQFHFWKKACKTSVKVHRRMLGNYKLFNHLTEN